MLLEPATITLSAEESQLLDEQIDLLKKLGFEVELFGPNSYRLRAMPAMLIGSNPEAALRVVIEDFVQIGSHCSIYSISTIDGKTGQVKLKRNCKIGSHTVIMPGVIIGENSIVGASSFVNQDIPDNVIAVGVPAKVLKKIESEDYTD